MQFVTNAISSIYRLIRPNTKAQFIGRISITLLFVIMILFSSETRDLALFFLLMYIIIEFLDASLKESIGHGLPSGPTWFNAIINWVWRGFSFKK